MPPKQVRPGVPQALPRQRDRYVSLTVARGISSSILNPSPLPASRGGPWSAGISIWLLGDYMITDRFGRSGTRLPILPKKNLVIRIIRVFRAQQLTLEIQTFRVFPALLTHEVQVFRVFPPQLLTHEVQVFRVFPAQLLTHEVENNLSVTANHVNFTGVKWYFIPIL